MSRRILIAAVVLVLALVVGVGIVATLQLHGARSLLAGQLSAATGRAVTIGEVSLRLSLKPGLEAENVVIAEPSAASPLRTARIGRLDLVVALWPLLRDEVKIEEIEVDDAELVIEPGSTSPESDPSGSWSYRVQRARARNVRIEVRRNGESQKATIETLDFSTHHHGQVYEASLTGAFEQIDFDLDGSFDRRTETSGAADRAAVELTGKLAGASVSGKGSVVDPAGDRSIELRVEAEAPSLEVFAHAAGRELPKLGPVRFSGLLEVREGNVGLSDLDLVLGSRKQAWLEVTGHVDDVADRREFALKADFGFNDVRELGPLVGDPPHIGPIAGSASVHNHAGKTRVDAFTLKGGRKGVFEIDAHGTFDDVEALDGLDAHVDLSARDLAVIGEIARRELPPIGPVAFSGRVQGQVRKIVTEGVQLRLDQTRIQGSFTGTFPAAARPRLRVEASVPELHLDDVGIEPRHGSEAAKPARGEPDLPGPAFSDTALDLSALDAADGELSFRAERVIGVGGPLLRDFALDAKLEGGVLAARHVAFHFDGGSIRSKLDVDSTASPPSFALHSTGKGVRLGELVAQIDADKAYSGSVDAKIELRTTGDSPRALASGMSGDVAVACGAGTIATAHTGLMTRDLFKAVRHVAGRTEPSEVLNCLIVDFEFREGIGTARTLVVDAKDIVIVGEGSIDLVNEKLDLRLVPKPRDPGPLSMAATVKVGGPLTSPAIHIEMGSLLSSSAAALIKNIGSVTGVRRVWRMLRGGVSDRSLCSKLITESP